MNVALYIDGDNIQLNKKKLDSLFTKIKEENNLLINRVYADWKIEHNNNIWNETSIKHGIEEIQVSRLAGKNSTDNKIIVDIVEDLFMYENIDKFILIGCDKDYIHLIQKVHKYNKKFDVYGLKKQTSNIIINTCNKYYDIDEFIKENIVEKSNEKIEKPIEEDEKLKLLIKFVNTGISISELKKTIKDKGKKDLFGKEFRNLNVYIKNNYKYEFEVKIKKGKVMIYKINNII